MRKNNRRPFAQFSILEKNGGFTLFELIVVITILSVLSALTIPSINSWRENLQLNNATRDIYSNLQKAKLEAIKTRTNCFATFDANGYVIYLDAGGTVISSVSLSNYENVSFDTSKGGGDGLTFSGTDNGIAFSMTGLPRTLDLSALGSGTIFLKQDNRDKTAEISISKAGSIQIK